MTRIDNIGTIRDLGAARAIERLTRALAKMEAEVSTLRKNGVVVIQTTALGGGVVIRSATEPVAANYDYGAIWLKDRGGGQGDVISILGKNALGNKAWQWTAELV